MKARELETAKSELAQIKNYDGESPTVLVNDRGHLLVSAEDGKGFANYYGRLEGEFGCDGLPWVCEELEAWAEKHGGYWEWENAGVIAYCEA